MFSMAFHPVPDDIDENGHVNNAVYVNWLQIIATAHWRAVATADMQARYFWIIQRHEIDYRRPCHLGETLTATTWGENPRGARFDRCTRITGPDNSIRAESRTIWALMDRTSNRPARVPPQVAALFTMTA